MTVWYKAHLGSPQAAASGFGSSATMGELPLLPAQTSDAVIVGTVSGHQAFLSQDGTGIYTELYVSVERVFKTNSPGMLAGGRTTLLFEGGSLNVGGRRLHVSPVGGLPSEHVDSGRRYVLFLRYESKIDSYDVRKAWELTENGPKALQPSDGRGPEAELLLSMSEFQFLNEVEQTVSKTNQKR